MSVPRLFLVLALAGVGFSAAAEDDASRLVQATPAELVVTVTGADLGIFPVAINENSASAISYDLDTGIVQFAVGIAGAERYLDPLFCFNLSSDPAPTVGIQTLDANGHVVLSGIGLDTTLNYLLSDAEIRIRPPSHAQCFYYGESTGTFGLFGHEPAPLEVPVAEHVFGNRFEADERVSIEFANVPAFMIPGDELTYQVIVRNEGQTHLFDVALQELYPRNSELYLSTLITEVLWTCSDGGTERCPSASNDALNPFSLRFQGLDLPVGATLTFNVTRQVRPSSLTSTTIDLHAGVVAGSGSRAPFDVARHELNIVGDGDSLVAIDASARAGETALIDVSVLDANMQPVPSIQIDVVDDDGMVMDATSKISSDSTGIATFGASTTVADNYTIVFRSQDLGKASATVTIDAAAPANVDVNAASVSAIADGDDTFTFAIFVEDEYENPVSARLVSVIDDGGLTDISSADPFTDINGMTSFSATSTISGEFTVEFSAGTGITDVATANFAAGAPAAVAFHQQPTDTTESVAINPPVIVRFLDANGNWVEDDDQSDVTLRLQQNGDLVDFAFAYGVAENGEVIFDNLMVDNADVNYSLFAVGTHPGGVLSSAPSDTFEVSAP